MTLAWEDPCGLPVRTDPERAESILRQASGWHRATVGSAHGGCQITGSALLAEYDGNLRWDQADPAIHITGELLRQLDTRCREFLDAMYQVGEECGHRTDDYHAWRR